ncbi:putative ParB family transcriptional regulator, chromosome partitioning protein [Hollandina sp. SP2]
MTPKQRLGKGLGALLPLEDALNSAPNSGEVLLPLAKLRANPQQPRKHFDLASLRELADSIREHGIIQPLIVEEGGDGTYIIVAGERRSRAAALAGLTEVPALIRAYTDEQRMEVSLIENIQRTDLNPLEEAAAYKQLIDLTGLSQEEVAVKVGKNRSTVANALRLLKLPLAIQESLARGELSSGHARALLTVVNPLQQAALFHRIIASGLSVREAERFAAIGNRETPPSKPVLSRDPALTELEAQFIEFLGTKVSIEGGPTAGHYPHRVLFYGRSG